MIKTQVLYERWDPTGDWVTHVAIQTGTNPPYVWRTYSRGETIPQLPDDLAVLSKESADNLFEFKKAEISELCLSPGFGPQR